MKQNIVVLCLMFLCTSTALAADNGSIDEYRQIIEARCTSCHEAGRIEKAMAEGRNIGEILNKMQQMGAELTPRDKSVLGIFWGSPLKK
jgi:hypothetical protein